MVGGSAGGLMRLVKGNRRATKRKPLHVWVQFGNGQMLQQKGSAIQLATSLGENPACRILPREGC